MKIATLMLRGHIVDGANIGDSYIMVASCKNLEAQAQMQKERAMQAIGLFQRPY